MNFQALHAVPNGTVIKIAGNAPGTYAGQQVVFHTFDLSVMQVVCYPADRPNEKIRIRPDQVERIVTDVTAQQLRDRLTRPVPLKEAVVQAAEELLADLPPYEKACRLDDWITAHPDSTKKAAGEHFGIPQSQIPAYLWLATFAAPEQIAKVQSGGMDR